jgi:hypothetical protein
MKCMTVNQIGARGRRKEKKGLCGCISEIRAIRNSVPELERGWQMARIPGCAARLSWVKPSRTQSNPVKPVKPVKGEFKVQSAFAKATVDKGSKFKVEEASRSQSKPVKPSQTSSASVKAVRRMVASPKAAIFAHRLCQANRTTRVPGPHGGCKTRNFRQACGL